MSISVTIGGTSVSLLARTTPHIHDTLDQRSTATFDVYDATGTLHFSNGQPVVIVDSVLGEVFTGYMNDSTEKNLPPNAAIVHTINCIDQHYLADKRVSQRDYTNLYAGDIVVDLLNNYLAPEGVTAFYAQSSDSTASDFATGALSGVTPATNVGDGNLELAASGTAISIVENTTATFSTGVLTNMTAASNTLAPTATPAMKMVATCSILGLANAYSYVKFWNGSHTMASSEVFSYDIWIDPSSPDGRMGVDLVFSDLATFRDKAIIGQSDDRSIMPHPTNDLFPYAKGQWYHRSFTIAATGGGANPFTGKTLQYAVIVAESEAVGTFTCWVKNVKLVGSGTINLFQTTLNVNPPQQLQISGYSTTKVSVVNTYDLNASNRVSTAYSIDAAKILQLSYTAWTATEPTGTAFQLSYSIDGGTTYEVCTNNQPLPLLPVGINTGGKSLTLKEKFVYASTSGSTVFVSPESKPILTALSVVINPSYANIKTDINYKANTSTAWNAGTKTNTVANGGTLNLIGFSRNYAVTYPALDQITFGNFVTNNNPPGYQGWGVHQSSYIMSVNNTKDGRSRMDPAGNTWQDFTMECDVSIDDGACEYGLVYRTTGWQNNNDSAAYEVILSTTAVTFGYGNNSSSGTPPPFTQLQTQAITLSTGNIHRLKVVVLGNSHSIYLDDVLIFTNTNSQYTAAGYVGMRFYNGNGGGAAGYRTAFFSNFGIMSVLTGTWVSPTTSLTAVGAYGGSVISWIDTSDDPSNTNTVLVEASTDNGATYATCTNGAALPGLTLGQSMSGKNLKVRVTLTTSTVTTMPGITGLVVDVISQLSSTGQRISPGLSLSNVGRAGSTNVVWNALVPPNTTLLIDTSLDKNNWTNIGTGPTGNAPVASIFAQPDVIEDTFSGNTASFYTNSFQTNGAAATWTWDTANSRLTASGGTKAQLLYSSATTDDVDMVVDLTVSDAGGMVWRVKNSSNFYDLVIGDGSSPLPNLATLSKVVNNSRSTLATGSITWVRGTPHRIRVTMLGPLITIYFDGSQIISYTDNFPLGVGQFGLRTDTVSGASAATFYYFRLQELGDSVLNTTVFTRQRFTSIDPTVTPQLTDITVSVRSPAIQTGAFIPSTTFSVLNGSTNTVATDLDDLAKQSNYWWRIDKNKNISFQAHNGTIAPYVLTNNDMLIPFGISIKNSADLYRNVPWILGGTDTLLLTHVFVADGITQNIALEYPVESIVSMNDGVRSYTFGIKGVDIGKDFYFQVGNNTVNQDATLMPIVRGIKITISYYGQVNVVANVQNASTITARGILEGTSGIVEVPETAQGLNRAAAVQLAASRLAQYGMLAQTLTCTTARAGLGAGQLVSVFLPQHGITNGQYLITDCQTTWRMDTMRGTLDATPYFSITATAGPLLNAWATTLAGMGR